MISNSLQLMYKRTSYWKNKYSIHVLYLYFKKTNQLCKQNILLNYYSVFHLDMNNKEDKNKIFVKIDLITVKKLSKLASPHEIEPDLITKVIDHALVCDKWCLDQKEEQI